MVGQTISHYRVHRLLGAGGMGEVYEAEDLRLGRRIALKILPERVAGDASRRARFEREARAVAALSHPNIVTIHSIEESDGLHFITMELVEGRTLSSVIRTRGIRLHRLLELAIPMADAIAAAHQRGITHRDLKPGNVMVTAEDRPKVLDFGLAKLADADDPAAVSTVSTASLPSTEGHVLGTAAYMSPEQAEGLPVDHRTDIFSFGVVLYEMATGERPFKGETRASVISAILRDTPRPVTEIDPSIPVELARIIRRCMQKDREQRYQSAKDLRNELAELRSETDSGGSASLAHQRRAGLPRWRRAGVAAAALAMAALVAAGWWTSTAWRQARAGEARPGEAAPFSGLEAPVQVTADAGWEDEPALSPDGALVAYVSNESGRTDLWVVGVAGGNRVQLTDDAATEERPAWFPDQARIAYATDRGGSWAVWESPAPLGGSRSLLVPDARQPAISPDGTMIAFLRVDAKGKSRVHVAPVADPGAARRLTSEQGEDPRSEDGPSWSPDGRAICWAGYRALWAAPLSGGEPRRLTRQNEYDIEPAWLPDGRFVLFSSYRQGAFALWRVAVSGDGAPERVTGGAGPERHPSVSGNGRRLAFSSFSENDDLSVRDLASGREWAPTGSLRSETYPGFSPDGRTLVYAVDRASSSGTELWTMPAPGRQPPGAGARLSDQPGSASHPVFSPDGRWIAYFRVIDGRRDIWVIPAGGERPLRFTDDPADDIHPSWSPDGTRIAFVSTRDGSENIWTQAFDAGHPVGRPRAVTSGPGSKQYPAWSRQGASIAFIGTGLRGADVWLVDADGRRPARPLTSGTGARFVRWGASDRELYVAATWGGGTLSIRRVDPQSGGSRPLQPPLEIGHPESFPAFDVSRDGARIAFSRAKWLGDIWVAALGARH